MDNTIYRGQNEVLPPQYISRGKTLPGISIIVKDFETQQVIDFSNASIDFIWLKFDPDTELLTELTPVNDPSGDENGNLSYVFDSQDTNVVGTYYGYFDITYENSNTEQFPEGLGVRVNVI